MAFRENTPDEERPEDKTLAKCLERIDKRPTAGKTVSGALRVAREKLRGERLAVVEETAAWAMGLKRKKRRR